MLLDKRTIQMGDRRRLWVRYMDFLERGQKVTSFTATVNAGAVSTVDTVSLDNDADSGVLYVNAAAVKETFTVTVQAVLNTTEVVTDTISFSTV